MNILITGITGQDGIFLTKYLLNNFNKVKILGVSRSSKLDDFYLKSKISENLLNSNQEIDVKNINLLSFDIVFSLIKDFKPKLIFNLSGPSSVYDSLKFPEQKKEIEKIFNNLTLACIENKVFPKFFQASTSEMYGLNNKEVIYSEDSNFIPNSPYSEGKLKNHNNVKLFHETYDWNIYSGIMFNHESEFRKNNYLFMKIIDNAYQIKNGISSELILGSLDYVRDWSYAKDIAEGIFKITYEGKSFNYVLGSGKGNSIKEVVEKVFKIFDLNYQEYINVDNSLLRKNDPVEIISNPVKAYTDLKWKTDYGINQIIEEIIKKRYSLI